MKDFPAFSTENGVASLIMKEIPYRREAFIQIQSSLEPEKLLDECISFCRMCGAEKIYASGDDVLMKYPLHTVIYKMQGFIAFGEDEIPSVFPVTEQTVSSWRECYNRKMRSVDNASTLETRDERRILESGGAYFIHDRSGPLGIGWLEGNHLEAIASVHPGAGVQIMKAMQSIHPWEQMTLEVASTNRKAIALYERLGMLKIAEISRWYKVHDSMN